MKAKCKNKVFSVFFLSGIQVLENILCLIFSAEFSYKRSNSQTIDQSIKQALKQQNPFISHPDILFSLLFVFFFFFSYLYVNYITQYFSFTISLFRYLTFLQLSISLFCALIRVLNFSYFLLLTCNLELVEGLSTNLSSQLVAESECFSLQQFYPLLLLYHYLEIQIAHSLYYTTLLREIPSYYYSCKFKYKYLIFDYLFT